MLRTSGGARILGATSCSTQVAGNLAACRRRHAPRRNQVHSAAGCIGKALHACYTSHKQVDVHINSARMTDDGRHRRTPQAAWLRGTSVGAVAANSTQLTCRNHGIVKCALDLDFAITRSSNFVYSARVKLLRMMGGNWRGMAADIHTCNVLQVCENVMLLSSYRSDYSQCMDVRIGVRYHAARMQASMLLPRLLPHGKQAVATQRTRIDLESTHHSLFLRQVCTHLPVKRGKVEPSCIQDPATICHVRRVMDLLHGGRSD